MANETLIIAMPVYDKIEPLAWSAHLALMGHLARRFDENQLYVMHVHRLAQPHAENKLMHAANRLRTQEDKPFDWLLWIESDTCPPADAFDVLREQADAREHRVVHAVSFDREPPYDPSIWDQVTNDKGEIVGVRPIREWEPDRLYPVAHSGLCCSLFHMSVWDELERPWFRMRPFAPGEGGLVACMSLSIRFWQAGIQQYGYTGCVIPHIGEPVLIDENYSHHWRQLHPDRLGEDAVYLARKSQKNTHV